MTTPLRRGTPARYRLQVAGHLDPHWSPWFGALTLTHGSDGTTSLTGVVADQAELHGLLATIRDLGVVLLAVAALDSDRGDQAAVDREVGPGDVGRAVAGQEENEVGDLVRAGEAPGRALRGGAGGDVLGPNATGSGDGRSDAIASEP